MKSYILINWKKFLVILMFACFACYSLLRLIQYYQMMHGGHLTISSTEQRQSRCEDNWPNLDLFLPLAPTIRDLAELNALAFPSLALFWPQRHLNLLMITDGEAKGIETFIDILKRDINETFTNIASSSILLNIPPFRFEKGWDRQQWLMFWADNFTDTEYVGFLDSDAVFVTRVDKYDLYNDGKPIIRALYGKPLDFWWSWVSKSTYDVIGLKEPFFCMTYFPVIISTKHLTLMREHIRRQLRKRTFDEAFVAIMNSSIYSQFHIMCAYLWYFQRDSYYWTVGERDHFWKGPPAYGQVSSLGEANITKELFSSQQPHLALHWNYEAFRKDPGVMKHVLRSGICYSWPSLPTDEAFERKENLMIEPSIPSFCSDFTNRTSRINRYEWTFEGYDITPWDKDRALEAHQQRLSVVDKCPHEFDKKLMAKLSLF